jgi:hypothetical protein
MRKKNHLQAQCGKERAFISVVSGSLLIANGAEQ